MLWQVGSGQCLGLSATNYEKAVLIPFLWFKLGRQSLIVAQLVLGRSLVSIGPWAAP